MAGARLLLLKRRLSTARHVPPTGVGTAVFSQTRDGTLVAELGTASNVRYTEILNQPGMMTFTLPWAKLPGPTGEPEHAIETALKPGVHEVGFRRNGRVVWLGPVVSVQELGPNGTQAGRVVVTCEGLGAYLFRWIVDDGALPNANAARRYVDVDQATIARSLIEHHQAKGGGAYANIDTTQVQATGQLRTRTEYDPWRGVNIGEAIQALSATEGGFDWQIRPTDRAFLVHYPRRGMRRRNVTFNQANILELDRVIDANQQASRVVGFGDGFDESTLRASIQDNAAIAEYGLTEAKWTGSNITTPGVLQGHIRRRLELVKHPPNILSFPVRFGPTLPHGSFEVGDEIRVTYPSPFRDIDEWRRVVGLEHRPMAQGDEERAVVHLAPIGG